MSLKVLVQLRPVLLHDVDTGLSYTKGITCRSELVIVNELGGDGYSTHEVLGSASLEHANLMTTSPAFQCTHETSNTSTNDSD